MWCDFHQVYYAVRESLALPFAWNPIVVFITRFMTVRRQAGHHSRPKQPLEGAHQSRWHTSGNLKSTCRVEGRCNGARGASRLTDLYPVVSLVSCPWRDVSCRVMCDGQVFAGVIAVSKDLPDVEGDVKYKVNTFAAVSLLAGRAGEAGRGGPWLWDKGGECVPLGVAMMRMRMMIMMILCTGSPRSVCVTPLGPLGERAG
jgi:hypothetical protein